MDNDIFSGLSGFGLSPYEIKVYSTLALKGELTPSQIVRVSGIPQPRVYDVLRNLHDKGLVEFSPTKKRVYRALPVKGALESRIRNMETYIEELSLYIEKERNVNVNQSPSLWIATGTAQILQRMRQIIKNSKTEVIISLDVVKLEPLLSVLRDAVERGISVIMVLFNENSEKTELPDMGGMVVRWRESKASDVLIVDRNIGLINLERGGEQVEYAAVFDEDELIHILNYYFYHTIWSPSKYVVDFNNSTARKFVTAWLTCEAIEAYSPLHGKIGAELECNYQGKKTILKGTVEKTLRIAGLRHTFFIETTGGTVSVGGKTARLEQARLISVNLKL